VCGSVNTYVYGKLLFLFICLCLFFTHTYTHTRYTYGSLLRCEDARNNIAIDGSGKIHYAAAGVVVGYDAKAHEQTHFVGE
jgi:hypothetical protein